MNAPTFLSSLSIDQSTATAVPLSQCGKYQSLMITEIQQKAVFGAQEATVTNRLKELGFLPGAHLEVIGFGLLGRDPIAVRINGTKFALRKAEASKILVLPSQTLHV